MRDNPIAVMILTIVISAVSGVAFAFTTFQTKAEADKESSRLVQSIGEIKDAMKSIDEKLYRLLQRR